MQPGDVIGDRYTVEQRIAAGGMADVFRARDQRLERAVAVKVFRSSRETDLDRFAAEVRLLARLRHPNLVQLYDGGTHDGVPYAVLELVDGPTLAQRLRAGPLSPREVRATGRDVAAALAYVHEHGVVHRDVKPSNVLVDRSGRALLGDFGIARIAGSTRLTSTSMTIGTGLYMAPEQLAGDDVTAAVDVYALGLVLVECLSGAPPFPGTLQEAMLARLARDPAIPANADADLAPLLRRMTARAPAERPAARAVAATLDSDVTAAEPATTKAAALLVPTEVMPRAAPPPAYAAAPGPGPTRRRGLLVAALVVLAAIGVAALALRDGDGPVLVGATTTPAVTAPATAAPTQPPETTLPPETEPATTVPPAEATTVPADQCAELEAQLDALEQEKEAMEDSFKPPPGAPPELKEQLDAEKEAFEEQFDAEKESIEQAMDDLDC